MIGSFGYSANDIIYQWAPSPVSIDELGMAQFLLKEYSSRESIELSNRRTRFEMTHITLVKTNANYEINNTKNIEHVQSGKVQ